MKRVERVGYMQAIYDTSEGGGTGINDGMSYLTPTTDGSGDGGIYVEPTPVYYPADPILPVKPVDEVFISEPIPQSPDTNPVYVDSGGNPVDYTEVNQPADIDIQPQLVPTSDVQTVIDPGTAQTETTTSTTPTTDANKVVELVKANPLLALLLGYALYKGLKQN